MSEAPSPRRRQLQHGLLALVVALAVTAALLWWFKPRPGPLDAVPEPSLVVLDVDVRGLRESPLRERAEAALRARVPLNKLDQACGFATLSRLERAVLTIGEGEAGGVGLALAGQLAEKELLNCETQLIIGAVGETKNQLEKSTRHGRFLLTPMRLADVDFVLGWGLGQPLLVATPSWTEKLADAADAPHNHTWTRWFDRSPQLPAPHGEVRKHLAQSAAGLPLLLAASVKRPSGVPDPLALLATWLPSGELVARAAQIKELSALGLALTLSPNGKRAKLHAVAELGDEASAQALVDVLLGARLAFGQNLLARALGLGALLDSLRAEAKGRWVTASLEDDTHALADHLEKAGELMTGASAK